MTREEAIKYIEQHNHIDDVVKDMCIEALEKKIPKKVVKIAIPNRHYRKARTRYECPRCHKINHMYETDFCVLCGQALDWTEEGE